MKQFTDDEWRALFATLVTPKLRPILEITLDTFEDYSRVFGLISVEMRDKYYNGLSAVDTEDFTQAEWQLAFELPAAEFKRRFMDKMNFDDLFDMVYEIGL